MLTSVNQENRADPATQQGQAETPARAQEDFASDGRSAIDMIRSQLWQFQTDNIVKVRDLRHLAKESSLHQALSRMCRKGVLHRVERGVYRLNSVPGDRLPQANRELEQCWRFLASRES